MKKLTLLVLVLLTFVPLFGQKSSFKLLDNPVYSPMANPDSLFTIESIRRDKDNWPVIDLGFNFPGINSDQLMVTGDGFNVEYQGLTLYFKLYKKFNIPRDSIGHMVYKENSTLKIKYNEFSGVKRTTIQFENMSFEKYPQFSLNYQLIIYSNGKIQVHYGPHNFNEIFPAYNSLYFGMSVLENFSVKDYFLVTEEQHNPKVYDKSVSYDEESFKPFPVIPQDWGFEFDVTEVSTFIEEISEEELEPLELIGDKLHIHPCTHRSGELSLYQANGTLLDSQKLQGVDQKLDLSLYHGQLLIVNYNCGLEHQHNRRFVIN